jgi:ABC-type branched-subunit amino acid transport system ATPase component
VFQGASGNIDLARAGPEAIVRAGLVQCPEGRQIFRSLTIARTSQWVLIRGATARRNLQLSSGCTCCFLS